MKKFTSIIVLFLILLSPNIKGSGIDSLSINDQFIAVGETWYTDYFTNYAVYTNRSFFKDENGGLHMAFISNYKLYYYSSFDGGANWTEEEIITGYEGGIRQAVIYADENGNPYIGITVNPYYNYGNPTGVTYGHEFHYNLYFIYKNEEIWTTEEVYLSLSDMGFSGNYGGIVSELYRENDGTFVMMAYRYGWYSYGGDIWEFTRSNDGLWSDLNVIYSYNDTSVDHGLSSALCILKDNGEKDIIHSRSYNASGIPEIASIHFDGISWGSPVQISTDLYNHASWDMTTNSDGDFWLSYFNNDDGPKVYLYNGQENPVEIDLDMSLIDSIQSIKIQYCAEDILDLIVYPFNSDTAFLFISEDFGLNWNAPLYVERSMLSGVIAKSDQLGDQLSDLEFMRIVRVSDGIPYGPDSLFYTHVDQINTTALNVNNYEYAGDKLTFYPNPVTDMLTVNYILQEDGELNFKIYNMQGKVIVNEYINATAGVLNIKKDLTSIGSGTYIIEVYETAYPPDGLHRSAKKMLKLNSR